MSKIQIGTDPFLTLGILAHFSHFFGVVLNSSKKFHS